MKTTTGVSIKENIVQVVYDDEFAVFDRKPTGGKFGLTISFPINGKLVDRLESSGIIEVESFKPSGTIVFRKKPFFETHLFCDVLFDELERFAMIKKHQLHE